MDHVTLGSGTFSDISDVLATAKFDLCIFFASCLLPSLFNATVAATARQAATPRCLLPVPD